MDDVAVAFAFDDRILLGAAVSIRSLLDTAADATRYNIHILHPGLAPDIMADFESMSQGTRHRMRFHRIDNARFTGAPISRGSWREVVYFRLLLPEVLEEYDRVIYSDVDVCFCRDLADVFRTDISDCQWAGVVAEVNDADTVTHTHFPENPKPYIYMSGFMLMNLRKMREDRITERCFSVIREFGPRLRFFDLDTLNLAADSIKALPLAYVTLESVYALADMTEASEFGFLSRVYSREELEDARRNPAIIHYAGRLGKPWHRPRPPDYYQRYVDTIPPGLRKTTFRDWLRRLRARLFPKKFRLRDL